MEEKRSKQQILKRCSQAGGIRERQVKKELKGEGRRDQLFQEVCEARYFLSVLVSAFHLIPPPLFIGFFLCERWCRIVVKNVTPGGILPGFHSQLCFVIDC